MVFENPHLRNLPFRNSRKGVGVACFYRSNCCSQLYQQRAATAETNPNWWFKEAASLAWNPVSHFTCRGTQDFSFKFQSSL